MGEPRSTVIHPARFSDEVITAIREVLRDHLRQGDLILDPFAGVGGVHQLSDLFVTIGVELEEDWARASHPTVCADSLQLPFSDAQFDAVCTSPVYGNRMSDSHTARDGSLRRSYTHDLRRMTGDESRQLHRNNSGRLQWGHKYQEFHTQAWTEVLRVLKPAGLFVLNISDHVRSGKLEPVTDWHLETLRALGFRWIQEVRVATRRMRRGANHEVRVTHESVLVLRQADELGS